MNKEGARGALVLIGIDVYRDSTTGQVFQGMPPGDGPRIVVNMPIADAAYKAAGLPRPCGPSQEQIDAALAAQAAERDAIDVDVKPVPPTTPH